MIWIQDRFKEGDNCRNVNKNIKRRILTNLYTLSLFSQWVHWTILLPPPKEVTFSLRSVYLFVCLAVRRITEKLWTDFDEISWRGRAWPRDQWAQFSWWSGSPSGSRSPKSEIRIHWIIDYAGVRRRSACALWAFLVSIVSYLIVGF